MKDKVIKLFSGPVTDLPKASSYLVDLDRHDAERLIRKIRKFSGKALLVGGSFSESNGELEGQDLFFVKREAWLTSIAFQLTTRYGV